MKRGRRAELLSYRSEFIQIVLQHFHSEEKGALCQDLPVHIPQIFPKNTPKKKKKDGRIQTQACTAALEDTSQIIALIVARFYKINMK